MENVFLGLGSNLGNRELALFTAIEHLLRAGAIHSPLISPLYSSPALLPDDAPADWNIDYINAVAQAQTSLTPEALLEACKQTEARMDRIDRGRWSPREIDIDILAYGQNVIDSPQLVIPHPQLISRDFVLLPWHDIAPDWQHPQNKRTIRELCETLPNSTARPIDLPVKHAI